MAELFLVEDCVGYATLALNESANGVVKFRGKFQEANQVNKNKRMYPYEILNSNVEKLVETVQQRGLFGELDHPTDSIIHLANTSHLITKLWWDGNCLMGEGEILNTPAGKVLRSFIEAGARIGISSRGVGNGQVNNEGVLVIGESYKLITFDAVADPSTPAAYQQKYVGNKRESFEPVSRIQTAQPEETAKYGKKANPKALVSYFGQVLQARINEIKEKI
jgi:hypothetical protein